MKNKKFSIWQLLTVIFMTFIIITILIPVLHIVARSFSSPDKSAGMSGLQFWPSGFDLTNYKIVLSNNIIIPSFLNSVFITVVGTLINITLTAMAAYALTRPNLAGKKYLMAFFVVMLLFDPGLVPEYLVVQNLKLMGSYWSVILVSCVNVYYLMILMRYFSEIPEDIFEAAKIDGAGHIKTLTSVVLPLAKPGVATVTMFYTVIRWNEYLRSGIYLSTMEKTTLQVVLRRFIVSGDVASIIGHQNVLNYNELARIDYTALQYATIVIAVVPILIIYPLVLKYYQKGIISGGVKE